MKMPAKRQPTRMRCCAGKITEHVQIKTEDISCLVGERQVRRTPKGDRRIAPKLKWSSLVAALVAGMSLASLACQTAAGQNSRAKASGATSLGCSSFEMG